MSQWLAKSFCFYFSLQFPLQSSYMNKRHAIFLCFAGNATICNPKVLGSCVTPAFYKFTVTNMESECNCPRQCQQLTYDHSITQAMYSNHAINWIQSNISPNVSTDYIRRNYASISVGCLFTVEIAATNCLLPIRHLLL
jgi:hypothetical protein